MNYVRVLLGSTKPLWSVTLVSINVNEKYQSKNWNNAFCNGKCATSTFSRPIIEINEVTSTTKRHHLIKPPYFICVHTCVKRSQLDSLQCNECLQHGQLLNKTCTCAAVFPINFHQKPAIIESHWNKRPELESFHFCKAAYFIVPTLKRFCE